MKIGFFGGSFNPPTKAHIELAQKVIEKYVLDKVTFVPMGDFYVKEGLASSKDRLNMLKLACKPYEKLEVSDLEIRLNKKMDTIDAFREIEKHFQGIDRFFIMGADNFIKILEWKESLELVSKYKYIVFERDDINVNRFIEENLKEYKANFQIMENKEYKNSSSSKFRHDKNSFKEEVSKEVFKYIMKNNIY